MSRAVARASVATPGIFPARGPRIASLARATERFSMRILAVLLASMLLPSFAAAQDFPAKPIKLIVPFPAGGPNDITARVVGQRMSELTRQPVVIDNRGGQAGVLGT